MKSAFRTFTVTSGREVVGTIQQKGRHFVALLPSGQSLGTFGTDGDAAQAINANKNSDLAQSEGSVW